MPCPYHSDRGRAPAPARTEEGSLHLTRRAMLEWASLLGGLFIVGGASACAGTTDEESESGRGAASTGADYPFLAKYDGYGATLSGAALVKARGDLVKEWLVHHPAELFGELRAKR